MAVKCYLVLVAFTERMHDVRLVSYMTLLLLDHAMILKPTPRHVTKNCNIFRGLQVGSREVLRNQFCALNTVLIFLPSYHLSLGLLPCRARKYSQRLRTLPIIHVDRLNSPL